MATYGFVIGFFVINVAVAEIFMSNEIMFSPDYNLTSHESFRLSSGQPWPKPSQYSVLSTKFLVIDPNSFTIESLSKHRCDIVERGIERFSELIFRSPSDKAHVFNFYKHSFEFAKHYTDYGGMLKSLLVDFQGQCEDYPNENMTEMYTLRINGPDKHGAAILSSNSVWGILRGLSTFSQLVYEDQNTGFQFQINSVLIMDFPRFTHRGVMLDTSRHYLSTSIIKTQLELMELNKFNVLHWHIVDDPSFPFQSYVYTNLSEKGSFNERTHIYTHNDVRDIIEFARLRGIRTLAELDVPGHTRSWGKGYPDLLTKCYSEEGVSGPMGPMDPSKNYTFEFIEELMGEFFDLFPESYFHVGGDEVDLNCWKSNPDVQKFVTEVLKTDDYGKVVIYFMERVMELIKKRQYTKKLIMWQDVFENDPNVQKEVTLHIWKSGGWEDLIYNITSAGYDVLFSSCWYLNYITYGVDWHPFYKCDPAGPLNAKLAKHLLGGEACMWGEYVDGTNLTPRLWPRACAVAERLWSPSNVTDLNDAADRIHEQRCRLLKWGYQVEPINGPGFCPYDA